MRLGPVVSVVIPAKNAASTLPRTLASVSAAARRSPVPVEVVVVDDGSTDGTSDVAWSWGCRVVRAHGTSTHRDGPFLKDLGVVRNLGLEAAKGTVIANLDADCEVSSDYFRAILAGLREADVVHLKRRSRETDGVGGHVYALATDWIPAEPVLAFRRAACPAPCFAPAGWGEGFGAVSAMGWPARADATVRTSMTGWREAMGLGVVVAAALGVAKGIGVLA